MLTLFSVASEYYVCDSRDISILISSWIFDLLGSSWILTSRFLIIYVTTLFRAKWSYQQASRGPIIRALVCELGSSLPISHALSPCSSAEMSFGIWDRPISPISETDRDERRIGRADSSTREEEEEEGLLILSQKKPSGGVGFLDA